MQSAPKMRNLVWTLGRAGRVKARSNVCLSEGNQEACRAEHPTLLSVLKMRSWANSEGDPLVKLEHDACHPGCREAACGQRALKRAY